MDQLDRDAIAAEKAGLSYGKYMAQKGQKPPAVRYPKKRARKESAEAMPDPEVRICGICGKPVPSDYKGRKYCSAACADEARRQQVREHNLRARAARLAELAAGGENA